MTQSPPAWLAALQPVRDPKLQPVRPGSSFHAWHISISLEAWQVPTGRVLSGSDDLNGKLLSYRSRRQLSEASELPTAFPDASAYWTAGSGNPSEIWRPWALR